MNNLDERCALCRDAGFPDILAHFKAVRAGESHDGKAHPALCYDHKHGKMPKFLAGKINADRMAEDPLPAERDASVEEARVDSPKCYCGRPLGHRGRHIGSKNQLNKASSGESQAVNGGRPEAALLRVEPKAKLKPRSPITQAAVEEAFPTAEGIVGDSIIRVQLRGGEVALIYQGDTLSLLADAEDLKFVQGLVRLMQNRGNGHPFINPKAQRTGKFFDIKMDEGFVDDMISMLQPEEKARLLNYLYTKQETP